MLFSLRERPSGYGEDNGNFAALLRKYIDASLYTYGQLAKLSGVPKRTIVNWLDGTVRQPRQWQSVVRVLAALRLSRKECDEILAAAKLPSLQHLLAQSHREQDRKLLSHWPIEELAAKNSAATLLQNYLQTLRGEITRLPVYFPSRTDFSFAEIYQDMRVRRVDGTDVARPLPNEAEDQRWSDVRLESRITVILGQPGMGKTWMLKFEALRLATEGAHSRRPGQIEVLPLLIRLPDLAAHINERSTLRDMIGIIAQLAARITPLLPEGELVNALKEFMERSPHRTVLILDALDEVPSRDGLQILARRAVMRLAASTPARILLASRPLGYSAAPLGRYLGPDVAEYELLRFSEGEVTRVIQAWFHKRVPLLRRLQIALRRSPTLIHEARNPLLLSFICMLNETRGDDIVANRAILYEFVLRLLLEGRWRDFELLLPESRIRAKQRVLEAIAWHFSTYRNTWWDHLSGDEIDGALDKLPDAQKLWTTWRTEWGAHYEGPLWELSEWDGILVKGRIAVDGMASAIPYAFLHRTFQEFLVARLLLRRYHEEAFAAPEIEEFLTRRIFDPQWYVVTLMLIEQAMLLPLHESLPILQRLIEVTLNVDKDPTGRLSVATVEILLKLKQSEVGVPVVDALRDRLLELARDRKHPLALRSHAGRLVAELGDPRAEVMDVDAIEFVQVPAGMFMMGSDPRLDADATIDEIPQHEVTTRAYAISRLPITNAQYRVFLEDANGYSNPAYWSEAIALGHWRDGKVWRLGPSYRADGTVEAEPQWMREPNYMGWPTDLPNVPIMGICWYEARAFARWLEERWQRTGKISPTTRLDLPSEAEWEKAARGVDGRIYPWGNEFDGNCLSWLGEILMAHAPAGLFPDSASPYGAEEMVGNLWEWTRSIFTSYADTPDGIDFPNALSHDAKVAIRGGAYFSMRARCRCAARSATSVNGRTFATIRLVMAEE